MEQFFDKGLAQFTYAILFNKKLILIDPARDARPFYDYAAAQKATIVGIIETHPHADFISSHAEIQRKTGGKIYVSEKLNAQYPHQPVKEGDRIPLTEKVQLRIIETPGHSPDSISVILQENGTDRVVFTGDALLFGDVGRPDLREYGSNENEQRTYLAKALYHTLNEKYAPLNNEVIVYPTHGAGSLCGTAIRNVTSSTIGYEKQNNHAFHHATEAAFVSALLKELPFIPGYFPYDVELNRSGAADLKENITKVRSFPVNHPVPHNATVVDIRSRDVYQHSYYTNALNVPDGGKFETWLGTVIPPSQKFYVIGQDNSALDVAIKKLAKIGYETNIEGVFIYDLKKEIPTFLDGKPFKLKDAGKYTIIDVRNPNEYKAGKLIASAVNIPLPYLGKRLSAVPTDKPVVVHCASGYRSAIAASILRKQYPGLQILDLGEAIYQIQKEEAPDTK
ncbi:hypothetical protein A8C56_10950 [Niabella ginsenosidivorans]|uniref:Rhodanese domain-containing protein n=1 Tax=Niabella ginsenosidivorans TaxID=1176587 RepID=A0A1A9IAS2_9BACT|nr:hypothetical protein A8C56_10950 [Niabella ginsenosidivorans]